MSDAASPIRRPPRALRARLEAPGSPWDLAPGLDELGDLATWRRGARLWRALHDEGYTMLSSRRGRTLHRLAATAERDGVAGALVDCGAWNGGSTLLLSDGAPTREAWAFDSFQGNPDPGPQDGPGAEAMRGDCRGSADAVHDAFRRFGRPDRLRVAAGWFEDTFGPALARMDAVAIVHADGNWHDSIALTLETFYDRLSPGGYVVIDDYGHWEGARLATDDFRAGRGIDAPLRRADYTGVHWRKP